MHIHMKWCLQSVFINSSPVLVAIETCSSELAFALCLPWPLRSLLYPCKSWHLRTYVHFCSGGPDKVWKSCWCYASCRPWSFLRWLECKCNILPCPYSRRIVNIQQKCECVLSNLVSRARLKWCQVHIAVITSVNTTIAVGVSGLSAAYWLQRHNLCTSYARHLPRTSGGLFDTRWQGLASLVFRQKM